MGSYIEELYGPWDDETQWEFFDLWFRPENTFVVMGGGDTVGVVGLVHHVDQVYVTRIEVHPDAQNQGIGTAVLRQILQEAGEVGKAVSLHVFGINPARRLYERLGFRPLSGHDGRILMKAIPQRGQGESPGGRRCSSGCRPDPARSS